MENIEREMRDNSSRLIKSDAWDKANTLYSETLRMVEGFLSMDAIQLITELVQSSGEVANRIATAYVVEGEKEAISFLHEAQGKLARFEEVLLMTYDLGFIDDKAKATIYKVFNDTVLGIKACMEGREYKRLPGLRIVK